MKAFELFHSLVGEKDIEQYEVIIQTTSNDNTYEGINDVKIDHTDKKIVIYSEP